MAPPFRPGRPKFATGDFVSREGALSDKVEHGHQE